jgi:hypothetical protein
MSWPTALASPSLTSKSIKKPANSPIFAHMRKAGSVHVEQNRDQPLFKANCFKHKIKRGKEQKL